jgi:hypothetical protein
MPKSVRDPEKTFDLDPPASSLNPMHLYTLRYRESVQGVKTGFIVATSLKRAEEVGKHYCNSHPARRFITVESAILADESVLPDYVPPELQTA